MCSTPKISTNDTTTTETVATPTYADASVSKASTNTRNKAASLSSRNVKTGARGLSDDATTSKKGLLGE
ncbi:MAG: hypothetical protein LUH11_00935 [Candidatus Gastranaerophilales bacterium]|nr:hypothetical protein [Candidatus Gastranaerophilales bacterium]